jgi:hypothetical protein
MKYFNALAAGIIAAVRASRPMVAKSEPGALPALDAFLKAADDEIARSDGGA